MDDFDEGFLLPLHSKIVNNKFLGFSLEFSNGKIGYDVNFIRILILIRLDIVRSRG
jgi:hypothetical protein